MDNQKNNAPFTGVFEGNPHRVMNEGQAIHGCYVPQNNGMNEGNPLRMTEPHEAHKTNSHNFNGELATVLPQISTVLGHLTMATTHLLGLVGHAANVPVTLGQTILGNTQTPSQLPPQKINQTFQNQAVLPLVPRQPQIIQETQLKRVEQPLFGLMASPGDKDLSPPTVAPQTELVRFESLADDLFTTLAEQIVSQQEQNLSPKFATPKEPSKTNRRGRKPQENKQAPKICRKRGQTVVPSTSSNEPQMKKMIRKSPRMLTPSPSTSTSTGPPEKLVAESTSSEAPPVTNVLSWLSRMAPANGSLVV